jgi:protocatechuate 3,4-dioxygenase beta subunit
MRALRSCILIAALVSIVAPAARAQAPARDTKAPQTGTAIIKGRVTSAENGAPLRRVRLVLSAPALSRPFYAATDAQGRYEFTELPAGRYTLSASKNTYVTLQYGQRRAFESGKPIELADGVMMEKVDFTLPRGCVIAGTVVDQAGEPVAGVQVAALRSRYVSGKRKLDSVGRAVDTNDLGQYRLYGLQPGTYCVGTRPVPGPSDDGYPFAPSYYPGTVNLSEAQRVTIGLGQERSAVNIVQSEGRVVKVSGRIIDPEGGPLTTATVGVVNPSDGHVLNAIVRPDGTFVVPNVAPGEYGVTATVRDPATGGLSMAMLWVPVYGEDVTGLVLQMVPGSHLTGRVTTEGGKLPAEAPRGLRVDPVLLETSLAMRMGAIGAQGIVNSDWTFDMKGIGGSLLFRMKPPEGYMLKSVVLDGRDITDVPLEVRGTEEINGLQVVLTSRVTEVNGGVTDAKGQPVHDYAVVVFAEEAARWKWPSRYLFTARPDQQERFKIANLPRGRYLAVALEYLEDGQSEDPEFLESLRLSATSFTLDDGETRTLALKIRR